MRYRTLAERRRRAEAQARERQADAAWAVDRIINNYVQAMREYCGQRPDIWYDKGWYKIARGRTYDAFRAKEIMAMTDSLLAKIQVKMTQEQIEHPELLEDN